MLSRLLVQSIKLSQLSQKQCSASFHLTCHVAESLKYKKIHYIPIRHFNHKHQRSNSEDSYYRIFFPAALLAVGVKLVNDHLDDFHVDPNILRYVSPGAIFKRDSDNFSPSESSKLKKPTFQTDSSKHKSSTSNEAFAKKISHSSAASTDTTSKASTEKPKEPSKNTANDIKAPAGEQSELDDNFEDDDDDEVLPLPEFISPYVPTSFPDFAPYVIIGGGTTGMSAARAIRASDPTSQVLIISSEADISNPGPGILEEFYPYIKPPLSKDLWRRSTTRQAEMMDPKGDMRKHSWIYYESDNFFLKPENLLQCTYGGIAFWKGKKVVDLDVVKREVVLENGHRIGYNQCLLATGSRPKRLKKFDYCSSSGADLVQKGRVSYFRSMNDFKRLQSLVQTYAEKGGRVAVVGGGFLGTELAMSLGRLAQKSDKLKVLQIYRELGNYAHTLPSYLAGHTRDCLSKNKITVKHLSEVTEIRCTNDGKLTLNVVNTVDSSQKETQVVDHVIVALGVEANTDLAKGGNLEVDPILGGYLVNSELEARSGVYVAGDSASYFDPLLGRRRVEHINHAEESGQIAGKNMAASCAVQRDGDRTRITNWSRSEYRNQSSFWSTLGPELAFEAVGLTDARKLQTYAYMAFENSDDDPDAKMNAVDHRPNYDYPGVIFYVDRSTKRIVGVLLWNLPDELYSDTKYFAPSRLNLARHLLSQQIVAESEEQLLELAKDFDIYETVDDEFQELRKKMESRLEEEARELEAEFSKKESN